MIFTDIPLKENKSLTKEFLSYSVASLGQPKSISQMSSTSKRFSLKGDRFTPFIKSPPFHARRNHLFGCSPSCLFCNINGALVLYTEPTRVRYTPSPQKQQLCWGPQDVGMNGGSRSVRSDMLSIIRLILYNLYGCSGCLPVGNTKQLYRPRPQSPKIALVGFLWAWHSNKNNKMCTTATS